MREHQLQILVSLSVLTRKLMQKTLLPLDTLVTLRQIMVIQLQLGIVLKLTEKIVYPLVMKALIAN
ncbi:Uncharacterised protein [Yersinia enterocolitica]|nr:Uncharacterised protein [Yersinia enterocolitica]CNF58900.1 Uncharacterised protein [Yersinia enterocolitica]CRY40347.1 Uncharacterised protein [Yersinia enterocolitica]